MAKRKNNKKDKGNIDLTVVGLIIVSILLAVLIFTKSGNIGKILSPTLGGAIGFIKYIIPFGMFAIAISIACHKEKVVNKKIMQYLLFLTCICVILFVYQISIGNLQLTDEFEDTLKKAYELGTKNQGGGVLGALIAMPLISLIGIVGTIILNAILSVVMLLFMIGLKPAEMIENIVSNVSERRKELKNEKSNEINEVKAEKEKKPKLKKEKTIKEQEEIPLEQHITINIPEEPVNKEEVNLFKQETEKKEEKTKEILTLEHAITIEDEHYEFPPLDFLELGETRWNKRK